MKQQDKAPFSAVNVEYSTMTDTGDVGCEKMQNTGRTAVNTCANNSSSGKENVENIINNGYLHWQFGCR